MLFYCLASQALSLQPLSCSRRFSGGCGVPVIVGLPAASVARVRQQVAEILLVAPRHGGCSWLVAATGG